MLHGLILCGGQATRLNGQIKGLIEVPQDTSFIYPGKKPTNILELQIQSLVRGGVECVWLISRYGIWTYRQWLMQYGDRLPCPVDIIDEKTPLGTGGAIKNAIQEIISKRVFRKDRKFFIYNGDIVHNDIEIINKMHEISEEKLVGNSNLIAGFKVPANEANQYGQILYDDWFKVQRFKEKCHSNVPVYINAGIYLFDRYNIQDVYDLKFSIEKDYFERWPKLQYMVPMNDKSKWLDVGTPERLKDLQENGI